eukprot:gene2933-1180_t
MKIFAVLLLLGILVGAFADPVHPDEDAAEGVDLLAEEGDSPDEDEAVGEDPISEEDTETEDEEGDTEEDPKSFESDVVEDSELADEQDGSVRSRNARVLAAHVIILESVEKRSKSAVEDDPVSTRHVVPAKRLNVVEESVPCTVHIAAHITNGSFGTKAARVIAAQLVITESVVKRSEGAMEDSVTTGHLVPVNLYHAPYTRAFATDCAPVDDPDGGGVDQFTGMQ